jgi:hypothetical protein
MMTHPHTPLTLAPSLLTHRTPLYTVWKVGRERGVAPLLPCGEYSNLNTNNSIHEKMSNVRVSSCDMTNGTIPQDFRLRGSYLVCAYDPPPGGGASHRSPLFLVPAASSVFQISATLLFFCLAFLNVIALVPAHATPPVEHNDGRDEV